MRIPVAAEGWPFIFPPAAAACILGWMGWWPAAAALGAVALCCLGSSATPTGSRRLSRARSWPRRMAA